MSDVVDSLNPGIDLDGLIDPQKVSVSPCSFSDPGKYYPAEHKLQKVVFAGHLQINKGVKILMEIIKAWPDSNNYTFVICGASDISAEVQAYARKITDIAGNNKNIVIQQSDNMTKILADAKVFLSLQTWDNYPSQSLIEAMLSGCNIVATAVGDTGLLVKEPWGVMLPVDAPGEHYVENIRKFLNLSDKEQKKYGEEAREFILKNHTVERYTEYLKKLWNQVL